MEDSIFAAEPAEDTNPVETLSTWHILVIDDEAGVHQVTEMVLRDFKFDERPLKISNAYSAKEGLEIMSKEDDIALAIVDVVMETDDAGLEVVRRIREDLKNHYTRLVLRTGQPGQAPEEQVIINYDVDDYKDKTELTSNKLITLLYATLRSYRDICVIDQHRRSLEQVILSSTEIFETDSLATFASAVLVQVCNLLNLKGAIFYCTSLNEDLGEIEDYRVLAATGDMAQYQTKHRNDLPDHVLQAFEKARNNKHSFVEGDAYTGYFTTSHGSENLLFVSMAEDLSDMDHQLLDIYANNVAITYENLLLSNEIIDTQKELAYILGEAVEQRSKETGSHVRRVAMYSYLLAKLSGINDTDADIIKLASPLHDVGKIGIPDRILKKPGKFEPEEWEVMKTHAQIGADLLSKSDNEVIKMGRIIAGQHHERWEGGGYPNNLKGTDIHIAGRIAALADVFDALGCKRCYKDPWPLEDILSEIDKQKGKHFDPDLVELLHANINQFLEIRNQHPE
jgi:response regulator RpfG family c-di-GMP phosphodiesterase